MGEEQDTSPSKLSKEELIQSMDRVDREIAKVEQQIFKLKKKQVGYKIKPFVSKHASNTMDVVYEKLAQATSSLAILIKQWTSCCLFLMVIETSLTLVWCGQGFAFPSQLGYLLEGVS